MRSLAILVALSTVANGDEAATAKARAHFRKGVAQYVLNHFDEAIVEFEAGYAADPLPAFLFNLAQSHAKAGRKEKAIEFYRKYLDMGAPAQDAVMVQEAIDRLERELRPPPEPPPKIVTTSVTPAHDHSRPLQVVFPTGNQAPPGGEITSGRPPSAEIGSKLVAREPA